MSPSPPLPPLRLAAISSHPRHELVERLEGVLRDLGWVLDSHPFSNLALAVRFEIPQANLPRLRPALRALPWALSEASLGTLEDLERMPLADLPEDLPGSLHVTFVHAEPDLRGEIPAVPG